MINSLEFSQRLQEVIDYFEETASSFAEKIGVQRSSISHILSGRNKPSLDFVMKICNTYPEVELYWLLNGKGKFPSTEKNTTVVKEQKLETSTTAKEVLKNIAQPQPDIDINLDVDCIVIFYKNGTFKSYTK